MDGGMTTKRQYSEYSDFFSTQRESEYDQDTDPHQWESTQVRRDERDGRREPDSGLGHTQNYRTGYTQVEDDDAWTFTQRTEQPSIIYWKRRVYTETVGGIAHGNVFRKTDSSQTAR